MDPPEHTTTISQSDQASPQQPSATPETEAEAGTRSETSSAPLDGGPKLRDVGRETARRILEQAGELPSATGGAVERQQATSPPKSPAAAAGQSPDLFGQLEQIAAGLPPDQAEQLRRGIGDLNGYRSELIQYRDDLARSYQALEDEQQRLVRILQHPTMQRALHQAFGGDASPDGGPGGGVAPVDLAAQQWETETEKLLAGELQRTRGQVDQLGRQVDALSRLQERSLQEYEQRLVAEFSELVAGAHKELDQRYPELTSDRDKYRQWHETAARLAGDDLSPQSVRTALEQAAKLLSYDHAETRGATRAMETARRAARSTTVPDAGVGHDREGPRDDESLGKFVARKAREAGRHDLLRV